VVCEVGVQHALLVQVWPLAQTALVQVTVEPQPSEAVPPHWVPHACAIVFGEQQAFW
jgi:hypothetical protein